MASPHEFKSFTDSQYVQYWRNRCSTNENGCWIWPVQHRRKDRPGFFTYPEANFRGKRIRLNRQLLSMKLGRELGPDEQSLHSCDNELCINPDHLYVGDRVKNMRDAAERKRLYRQSVTHCIRGHEYTPENTYYSPSKIGNPAKNCKACARERQRRDRIEKPDIVRARQRRNRARRKERLQFRVDEVQK